MKKVLVTGAGGFIGSHLCEHLVRTGHSVRAFVHYNSKSSWGWLDSSELRKEMEMFSGDIRDFDSVSRACEKVDRVYHLAALIGIPYSYESPLAYVKTNVEGTYNILESARKQGVSRVLVTSTSEVYGTAQYVPIDEKHPMQPQSPYSATKIGADNLALSYFNSFSTPVVIARPFNTYGPRQSARAIIPTIATQLLAGAKEVKLGNLTPVRDLTYVTDTASAMQAICETDAFIGKSVNVGTGEAISIAELFQRLCEITGNKAKVLEDHQRVRPESSEVMRLISNNDQLRTNSSWKHRIPVSEGLKLTVEWLKQNLDAYKPDQYTR